MTNNKLPLSQDEFDSVYSKVPRLTIEIIIKNSEGSVFLAKRAIHPCKGQWHLPGGTVRFGELMTEALARIAERELGIKVDAAESRGYIDYPSHFRNGLDSPVGIVFEVIRYSGTLHANEEAMNTGWFNKLPKDMHADQDKFLLEKNYMN